MFGISSSELLVIAFVAILIFGPERVPEFFHRAGKLIRSLQDTADDVWTSLQTELNDVTEPIREAERDIKKLGGQIASSLSEPIEPTQPVDDEAEEGTENEGDS